MLMRTLILLTLFVALPSMAAEITPEKKAELQKLIKIRDSLHPQTGDIHLTEGDATLHLGQDYYYLPSDEAKNVLVNAWSNPPQAVSNVIGIVFPAKRHFWDANGWAAVITYNPSGFIDSTDGTAADFNRAANAIRNSEDSINEQRKKAGAVPVHFVGWAENPLFDRNLHTVIWARDLKFGGNDVDTLNYDVRVLGRRGFLSLNMVSTIPELQSVKISANELSRVVQYDNGSAYTDFNKSVDKKSGLGIAGLVAAGAGVALAQKVGLFAVIALFLKKAAILVVALFAGVGAWFKKLFSRKKAVNLIPPRTDNP